MNWETKNGTISGFQIVRILCTISDIGKIPFFHMADLYRLAPPFPKRQSHCHSLRPQPEPKSQCRQGNKYQETRRLPGSSFNPYNEHRSYHPGTSGSFRAPGLPPNGQVQRQAEEGDERHRPETVHGCLPHDNDRSGIQLRQVQYYDETSGFRHTGVRTTDAHYLIIEHDFSLVVP